MADYIVRTDPDGRVRLDLPAASVTMPPDAARELARALAHAAGPETTKDDAERARRAELERNTLLGALPKCRTCARPATVRSVLQVGAEVVGIETWCDAHADRACAYRSCAPAPTSDLPHAAAVRAIRARGGDHG